MITFLAIAVPATVFLAGCAAIVRHRYRDDDPAPFNWQGTAPAAPGMCSCGAPHAKVAPFPGEAPAVRYITARDVLPGLVAALTPQPAPVPSAKPEYVKTALDGHDDADGWVESRWRKIDGEMLAAQLRDGAL